MKNILLTICYDGSKYHGWQIQENAHTVQAELQKALYTILGDGLEIKGCSRTDSGVHANMYCISLKTEREIPLLRLRSALNNHLPKSIAVLNAQEVNDDFHARYSCKGKQYIYKIWNSEIKNPFLDGYAYHYRYKIDETLLDTAAKHYIGEHDFTSFCTFDARKKENLVRNVFESGVTREGNMVIFTVAADGFLYNMVRIFMGTLLRVQQGKLSANDIPRIIAAKDRKAAGPTAPSDGLYLNKVYY